MRRLLGAVLALALIASGAHAKGLVIVPTLTGSSNADKALRIQEDYVLNVLRNMGADFDAIRDNQIAAPAGTQNLRRGRFFNGIDSVTYNPIIHVGYRAGSYTGKGYNADSLTRRIYYPSVTHLFIGNHNEASPFTSAALCSAGVGPTFQYVGYEDSTRVTYVVGNPGIRWVQDNGGSIAPVLSTRDSRGFRPIWGNLHSAHFGSMTTGVASDFEVYDDSNIGTYPTDPDTVSLWAILNRENGTATPIQRGTQAAAVPMIFVHPVDHYATNGGEMSPYAAAFALADSFSGGGLSLASSKKLPRNIAIHIDDGWKRGDSRNGGSVYGGIEVRDTTLLKASIDSLAALGVPFVLGVEIDSLTSCWLDTTTVVDSCYTVGSSTTLHTKRAILGAAGALSPYFYPTLVGKKCSLVDGNGNYTTVVSVGVDSTLELNTAINVTMNSTVHTLFWDSTKVGNAMLYDGRWWARAPMAHFTPHCHAGTTTVKGQFQQGQPAQGPYWRMMDLWGTNTRVRTAWSGGTGLGQDSSFAFLHKRAFALLDSTFGSHRVDHVGMPPGDDWTPTYNTSTGVGKWPIPMTLDSLLFAWDFAGGRGIRNNSATNTSLVSQRLGSYGMYTGTMDYAVNLTATGAADHRGYRGRFLSCPSYPTSASSVSYSRLSSGKGMRAMNSILLGRITLPFLGSSTTNDEGALAQILAIHVSDLGGDKYGRPTRPGYYCIKYPVMASRAINALSRTPIVQFVYPEQLCP
jgi:hypothetical protein